MNLQQLKEYIELRIKDLNNRTTYHDCEYYGNSGRIDAYEDILSLIESEFIKNE